MAFLLTAANKQLPGNNEDDQEKLERPVIV